MKRYLTRIIIILLLLIIIGGLIYFVFQKQSEAEPEEQNITYQKITMITNIRLGISEYDTMNPILTQNRDIMNINQLIFEPLLTITEDYHITPCLAKEWSKVNSKSYVLKLNENIRWHDGSNFSSDDVKFTIETLQKNSSIYSENVREISSVESIDKYTVRINLKQEIPFFEYNLIFPIISKTQYENKNLKDANEVPLGTGKYKISKMDQEKIELTKNENWRNIENENANIKTITITKYQTMGEIYNAFKIGKIDLFQTSNPNLEEYIGSMGYKKAEYRGREYDYLAFNCQNEILQYQEVRRAISYAINQEEILLAVFQENAYSSYFSLDYGNYIIDDTKLQKNENDETAKKILKEAGWSYEYDTWKKKIDGKNYQLKFNLIVSKTNEQRVKVAEKIKKQLEKIGIQITIKEVSDNTYYSYLNNHNYELILAGVYNSYSPDLTSFLGENNLANYENEEIMMLLKEVQNIADEKLLKEKYEKILEIYQEEVPYIGLYRNKNMVIYSNNLMGDVKPNNYSIFYHFAEWYRQ